MKNRMKFTSIVLMSLFTGLTWAQSNRHQISVNFDHVAGLWSDPQRETSDYTMRSYAGNLGYRFDPGAFLLNAELDLMGGRMAPESGSGDDLAMFQFRFKLAYSAQLFRTESFRFFAGLQYQAINRLVSEDQNFQDNEPYQHFSRQGIDLKLGARYEVNKWTFEGFASVGLLSWVYLSAPGENATLDNALLDVSFANNTFHNWHQYFTAALRLEVSYNLNSWFALSANFDADLHVMEESSNFNFSNAAAGIGVKFMF
jgi:hypothetical protein